MQKILEKYLASGKGSVKMSAIVITIIFPKTLLLIQILSHEVSPSGLTQATYPNQNKTFSPGVISCPF